MNSGGGAYSPLTNAPLECENLHKGNAVTGDNFLQKLDGPEVTPPLLPVFAEHAVFGAADDWWFAGLLVVGGIVLLSGVFLNI